MIEMKKNRELIKKGDSCLFKKRIFWRNSMKIFLFVDEQMNQAILGILKS